MCLWVLSGDRLLGKHSGGKSAISYAGRMVEISAESKNRLKTLRAA
jgi:hypothetical protein